MAESKKAEHSLWCITSTELDRCILIHVKHVPENAVPQKRHKDIINWNCGQGLRDVPPATLTALSR